MLDEAERELIGRENVLIDTTWPPTLREVAAQTLAAIINKHGPDKVCFGTDYPLADQSKDADYLLELLCRTPTRSGFWEKRPGNSSGFRPNYSSSLNTRKTKAYSSATSFSRSNLPEAPGVTGVHVDFEQQ